MAFIRNTQTKIVRASGARKLRSRWKTSFTVLSMKSTSISTNACHLPGTPGVALCATE